MIRLNPPAHIEYHGFSLYDDEGVIDLFDVPCKETPEGRRFADDESSNGGPSQDFV